MELSRRKLLLGSLFGSGMVGLRALATGLPASFLLAEGRALADTPAAPAPAQYMIFSTSGSGDPLNANVPGSYDIANLYNCPTPEMAPTALTLGTTATKAAAPWAALPAALLARMAVIHNATTTNGHGNEYKVTTLMGRAKLPTGNGVETIQSLAASELADRLGTLQREPIRLGGETVTYGGRQLAQITPTGLRDLLVGAKSPLANLQALRDQTLDTINKSLSDQGMYAQKRFVDQYALSQHQLRNINQSLLGAFSTIVNDGPDDQIKAAINLILMKVSPVITIHLPFGGDNHNDVGYANESKQTVASVASIGSLFTQLQAAQLEDSVTLAVMNVFGRTLTKKTTGEGRDHNQNHHATILVGKNVNAGVIGGVRAFGADPAQGFTAMGIDSASGRASDTGDIPVAETLSSTGKTIAAAVGVAPDAIEKRINAGKVIRGAVKI